MKLELAWKRHAADLKQMAFVKAPYEIEIYENSIEEICGELQEKLEDGSFSPKRSEVVDIPKAGSHIRPGSVLDTNDGIVYHALVTQLAPLVQERMLWSASNSRFSYILCEDQTRKRWFVDEMKGWMNFARKSIEFIDQGYTYVLFADVSAFFENISLKRLASDLTDIGAKASTVKLLSTCLHRWAEPRGRGIPQGYRPSFVLSELYLDSVDRRLKAQGITFARYVDDCRLFFNSEEEAISGLHTFTRLLREKELNLQTKKSFILPASEARTEIDGVNPIIQQIQRDLFSEIADTLTSTVDYITPREIQTFVKENEESINVAGLERAFDEHVVHGSFDKTLFHFCINRLAAAGSAYALEFCIQCCVERPEELIPGLRYIVSFHESRFAGLHHISEVIQKRLPQTDRSAYEILRMLFELKLTSDQLLQFARTVLQHPTTSRHTKDYARAFLGENGDSSDLDAIESGYNVESNEVSKSTILASIRKMVIDRRNTVYGHAGNDSLLVTRTIAWVKGQTRPHGN